MVLSTCRDAAVPAALFALGLVAASGCGGAQPETAVPAEDRLAPANLYPLAEGNVWSYNVYNDATDLPALGQTKVVGAQGNRFEVSSNRSDAVIYERREGGIYNVSSGAWLLKAPVERGAEWPARSGRTARVTSVDAAVETENDRFTGCVRVEEAGGPSGQVVVTVFCPGIGPVFVETEMRAETSGMTAHVEARLLGYQLAEP
jgi:hypothetical protein